MSLSEILLTPQKRIRVNGGDVLHALKSSDPSYAGFGEAYFSWISSGAIKAWKKHTKMTMNILVPLGAIKFVFCEIQDYEIKDLRVEVISQSNYMRLTVPPGIWFGFQGLDSKPSLILNIANILHDPHEVERLKQHEINYIWS